MGAGGRGAGAGRGAPAGFGSGAVGLGSLAISISLAAYDEVEDPRHNLDDEQNRAAAEDMDELPQVAAIEERSAAK